MVLALASLPASVAGQSGAPTAPNPAFASITIPIARTLSGDRAYGMVDYVQRFYRDPGSRGFDAAIDSVVSLLRSAGYQPDSRPGPGYVPPAVALPSRLTYRIESRPINHLVWSPLAASITLAGRNTPLELLGADHDMLPSNSWSTPPEGIDAEIVSAGAGSDAELERAGVNGRIALVEPPADASGGRSAGSRGASVVQRAAAKGAVGILLGQRLPQFNQQEKNRRAIGFSSVPYDTSARIFVLFVSLAARDTLHAALATGPVRAHVVTSTVFERRPERTVVAEIRGAVAPEERFVYSAHVQEPGANDNASGVGLLAEMARTAAVLLRSGEIDPGRTITMLWGNETIQTRRFVQDDTGRRTGIRWGMSLDMVGENTARTGGSFLIEKMPDPSKIWVRGEDQHTEWGAGAPMTPQDIWPHYYNDFVKQRCVDQSYATGGSWIVKANPYEGGSDHTPFVAAHIPGVLMWHFTDQHYHDDLDRIEMVSAAELGHVGNCALAVSLILTAASHPEYARAVLDELAGIAERRLDAEGKLSHDALARADGDSIRERTIIEAWRDYYLGALAKVPEITLPRASLVSEVRQAQDRVGRRAAQVLFTMAPRKPEL